MFAKIIVWLHFHPSVIALIILMLVVMGFGTKLHGVFLVIIGISAFIYIILYAFGIARNLVYEYKQKEYHERSH